MWYMALTNHATQITKIVTNPVIKQQKLLWRVSQKSFKKNTMWFDSANKQAFRFINDFLRQWEQSEHFNWLLRPPII